MSRRIESSATPLWERTVSQLGRMCDEMLMTWTEVVLLSSNLNGVIVEKSRKSWVKTVGGSTGIWTLYFPRTSNGSCHLRQFRCYKNLTVFFQSRSLSALTCNRSTKIYSSPSSYWCGRARILKTSQKPGNPAGATWIPTLCWGACYLRGGYFKPSIGDRVLTVIGYIARKLMGMYMWVVSWNVSGRSGSSVHRRSTEKRTITFQ